jgi:cytidylate kinase
MSNRIITISREFGSGGRTIGKNLAEKLGIHCYDYELIEELVKISGFDKDYVKEQSEDAHRSGWLTSAFEGRGVDGLSNQDHLWIMQNKIILSLAEKESCVIVGRCADQILKGVADCLTVFIHADFMKRAERIVRVYGESEHTPEKRLIDKDKRRAAYYEFYTDMKWGHAQNYHIALDSGIFGIDKCVEIIAGLF